MKTTKVILLLTLITIFLSINSEPFNGDTFIPYMTHANTHMKIFYTCGKSFDIFPGMPIFPKECAETYGFVMVKAWNSIVMLEYSDTRVGNYLAWVCSH